MSARRFWKSWFDKNKNGRGAALRPNASGLTRRSFLVGAGATALALPFLPSLDVRAESGSFPKRVIFFYVPEGVATEHWFATGGLNDYTLSPSLEPLNPYKDVLSVYRRVNLNALKRDWGGFHEKSPRYALTGGERGSALSANGVRIENGMSIDRAIGLANKGDAPFVNASLGVMSDRSSETEQRFITYDDRESPVPPEVNPMAAFNQLLTGVDFGEGPTPAQMEAQRRLRRRGSVLDSLGQETRALHCKLGKAGREKTEAYFESVRSIETEISDLLGQETTTSIPRPGIEPHHGDTEFWREYENYQEVGKLQMDIAVAALATGRTNTVTLQWSHSLAYVRFKWLRDQFRHAGHADVDWHNISHESEECNLEHIRHDKMVISRWFASQMAYLVDQLRSIPEGDGTMFDNTVIVHFSEMTFGDHFHNDVPYLTLGSACGSFKAGQYIDFASDRESLTGDLEYQYWGANHNAFLAALGHGFGLTDLTGFGNGEFDGVLREILG